MVILRQCTCNRFTAGDVEEQWDLIQREYGAKVEPVLGPLIGHSSDGDSRRRKGMLKNMANIGDTFQPIPFYAGYYILC